MSIHEKDVIVQLHYQIYDGLPLIEKWLTVNTTRNNLRSNVSSRFSQFSQASVRFRVTSIGELAVNLDWSPSSLGAPETVNTFIHNVGGRDWLQVNVQPFILFYLHQMKSGHNRFSPWG